MEIRQYKKKYIYKYLFIYYIFIVFILKVKYIKPFKSFKSIPLQDNNYLLITSDKISFYNNAINKINSIHPFTYNQVITLEEEFEMIYFGRFYQVTVPNLLLVIIKNFAYAINEDGFFNCYQELTDIIGYYKSFIIAIKCTLTNCYYIFGLSNLNNKLFLFFYSNILFQCGSNLISKINIDSGSDNLSCQLIDSTSDQDIKLICFYEKNNSKEIIASTFNIDLTFGKEKIQEIKSISQSNNGGKIIKSYLSKIN